MFDDLRNSFDFYLRNRFRFSRKNFVEKNKDLIERNEAENLYTKAVLEQAFSKQNGSLKVLDIGCKNWFYAKGEFDFLKKRYAKFSMDGVELDAYRLYSNFYSRLEVAKYYTKELENTNYIVANLLELDKKYDYITWFLPFVVIQPHVFGGFRKNIFIPPKC